MDGMRSAGIETLFGFGTYSTSPANLTPETVDSLEVVADPPEIFTFSKTMSLILRFVLVIFVFELSKKTTAKVAPGVDNTEEEKDEEVDVEIFPYVPLQLETMLLIWINPAATS